MTTAGDFTNSGSLTVGAGSTLTVGGSFTQAAAGSLAVQIGGTPASGQFGQVAVTGSATLGGTFNVSLVNGFNPTLGQDYPVLSFASVTGDVRQDLGPPFRHDRDADGHRHSIWIQPPPAVDLAVTSVTAPTTAAVGQPITVNWQVQGRGATAAGRELAGQRLPLAHADRSPPARSCWARWCTPAAWAPAPSTTAA